MDCYEDLPPYLQEELTASCLLSTELSRSLPSIIHHELNELSHTLVPWERGLGQSAINVLNKLPIKEWIIAGGFMAFAAGHTKNYGDIDVFLYKFVSLEELGDEWEVFATLDDSWSYNFLSEFSWYYNFQHIAAGYDKYVVYNHKNLMLQLIVPFETKPELPFLNYCSDILMKFDIEYCKLGWLGTTKMVMDLRGIKSNQYIESPRF